MCNFFKNHFSMAFISKATVMEFLHKGNQWSIAIISSILLSFLTIGLDWSSTLLSDFKYGHCSNNVFGVEQACQDNWLEAFSNPILKFFNVMLWTFTFAAIASYITSTNDYIPKSGISELIMIIGGHQYNDFLEFGVVWKKLLSLIFVFGSGSLLIGYEGPLIHISCGMIYIIVKYASNKFKIFHSLDNPDTIRELLAVGFVIGISLAFETPIGGLLFAVENLKFGSRISKLIWYGFVSASIATFIFVQLHPFRTVGVNDSFAVETENNWIFIETFPYILVGFVAGLIAIAFNKLHIQITALRPKFIDVSNKKVLILEVIAVAGICQLLRYFLPFANLTMSEFLNTLFFDCELHGDDVKKPAICQASHLPFDLVYYLLILIFGSAYTYATQIPGGVLLPSLTMGALIGRIIGEFMQFLQRETNSSIFESCHAENKSCISPGSYALVGSAAMFAGVTNTYISAVLIVFELTGAVTYLVPLMLGVFISRSVNDILLGDHAGLYEQWLSFNTKDYIKPDLEDSMAISHFSAINLGEVSHYNIKEVFATDLLSIGDLNSIFDSMIDDDEDDNGIVVLNSQYERVIVGWISSKTIKQVLSEYDNSDSTLVSFSPSETDEQEDHIMPMHNHMTMAPELTLVSTQMSVLTGYEMFDRMGIDIIFVISPTSGQFLGIVSVSDIVKLQKS